MISHVMVILKYVAVYLGKTYVVKVGGTRGDSAKGGSKEVLVIGYGNLWFFKDLELLYKRKNVETKNIVEWV